MNRKFADAGAQVAAPTDMIWIQDYQLLLVPAMLRERLPDAAIGFFLHIDPTDYDTCAERVSYLLENPAEAQEMGRLGKEHVRENFLTTRLLGHWLAIFEELLLSRR